MEYYIIVFKNTHDAMNGEKVLQEKGVAIRIMPTPTLITQSCGICIRIEDKNEIDKIIEENTLIYKSIYKKNNEGYFQI